MARKNLPEKVWQMIRKDWAAGMPIAAIAAAYGVQKQTIYNKKAMEGWDKYAGDGGAIDSVLQARDEADKRVTAYIEESEKNIKGIIDRHRRVSDRIAALLEKTVSSIEADSEANPIKTLNALKTASDVASSLQKNERTSWGIDENHGASGLEDFLDKQEAKLTVINGGKP